MGRETHATQPRDPELDKIDRMSGRLEPEHRRPSSGKSWVRFLSILSNVLVRSRSPHLSRAKNHAASVAIQACGSQAATTGSTICLVASDEAKFVKR